MPKQLNRAGLKALMILFMIAVWSTVSEARNASCEDLLENRFERSTESQGTPSINFIERIGREESLFFRGGFLDLTTVQVRAVSGSRPLVGGFFPAGNTGAMMMLSSAVKEPELRVGENSFAVRLGTNRGISTPISATNLEFENGRHVLKIESLALGNVRFLRDHVVADHGTWVEYGKKPPEINEQSALANGDLVAYRTSLSGKSQYTMRIHPLNGATIEKRGDKWVIVGGSTDRIDFEITPTTSEPPRVGVNASKLVEPWYYARMTSTEKQKLEYLFYEDGAVAGAHAYTTYFGRDPLITGMIAQKAFTPYALKILIAAALDTLDAEGNVAHEPIQGERASYERKMNGEKPVNGFYDETTIYDRTMIDTQFLVMPLVEILLNKTNPTEVREFLAHKSRVILSKTYAELLSLNKQRIIAQARPFALAEMNRAGIIPDQANYIHLIHLLQGRSTGQWRDSDKGLAEGRIPYDVNTTFVPAALKAILSLQVLSLPGWTREEASTVQTYHEQWRVKPYHYFLEEIDAATALAAGNAYAQKLGIRIPAQDPFMGRPLKFFVVALDGNGKRIPVMHSDVAFSMLYTDPPEEYLPIMLKVFRLPYPWGLESPAGNFIATPAYASAQVQSWFKMSAYHAGVWSFQQELETVAITRQRARTDLSDLRQRELKITHFHVWRAIARNADWRSVELWSGKVQDGIVMRESFGTGKNIVAESCLDQFWSNTKIANFAPAGWENISPEALEKFMTWDGQAPLQTPAGI